MIFTGNGYSSEWPIEAAKRGLPNHTTTPLAIEAFANGKAKEAFTRMKVFSDDECEAFSETMYENYVATLTIEVQTMLSMVETGFMPALAKDLANYKDAPALAGDRAKVYPTIKAEADKLKSLMKSMPEGLAAESKYLCDTVKPQMAALRKLVDEAEQLMEKNLYPYPTYEQILYGHHF